MNIANKQSLRLMGKQVRDPDELSASLIDRMRAPNEGALCEVW